MGYIKVPDQFVHPLFYKEGVEIEIKEDLSLEDTSSLPFIFDMLHSKQIHIKIIPWMQKAETVKAIVNLWKEKQESISSLHKERNKEQIKVETPGAIALYMNFLFWINGKPVSKLTNLDTELETLFWKPVNVTERLSFILNKPYLYHSFVQLNELFTETEKLFVKVKMKEKR